MIVVDANVVFLAVTAEAGFAGLEGDGLVAPPLLWPEVRSALHVAAWRALLGGEVARSALATLDSGVVAERRHRRLGETSWRIADELGWAKTYDAEYLALARLRGGKVVTTDGRLLRGAARTGLVTDLAPVLA